MSNIVNKNGSVTLDIAASDKLAVFSTDGFKIYSLTAIAHHPNQWALLQEVEANTEYVSGAFSAAGQVRIEAGSADVLYQTGTDAVIVERRGVRGQGAPGVLNTTGALTAAMILSGIVTSTTAAAVAGTVPTGTVMGAAIDMEIGESVDWSVLATGGNAFTVTAATGHTVVGTGAVATTTSGLFRTRKTAAATFVTYRIG